MSSTEKKQRALLITCKTRTPLLEEGSLLKCFLNMDNPEGLTDAYNFHLNGLPYQLVYNEGTISIVGSDGQMVSKVALLPTEAIEYVHKDGIVQASLRATCFVNGLWLSPINVSGSLKKFDDFYKSWGLHKFPLLTTKEEWVSKKIFSHLALQLQAKKIYSFSAGWVDDALLINDLFISNEGVEFITNSVVQRKTSLVKLSTSEAFAFLRDVWLKILNEKAYSITFLLFLILGILYPKLLEYSTLLPSFLLYIRGLTGTRKTSSAIEMMNPFGFPMGSFEDTIASIASNLKQLSLGCFILDDLKAVTSEANIVINKVLRLVGDITTQGKKMRGGKVIDDRISAVCVVTGEVEPRLQESSMARMLVLPFDETTVNLDILTCVQQDKAKSTSSLIHLLVEVVRDQNIVPDLCGEVVKNRLLLQQKYTGEHIHGRYIDMMAWLISTFDIIMRYFVNNGSAIDFDYKAAIQDLIFRQHLAYHNASISVFARCLFELYDRNGVSVCTEAEFCKGQRADIIDYNTDWFIASGIVFEKVKQYAEKIGLTINFSEKRLRSELFNAKILKQVNGKNTYELRKEGNRCSGYYIRKNILLQFKEKEV